MKPYRPVTLVVLDGMADNPSSESNAVQAASTPTIDSLRKRFPNSHLATHGGRVGLPDGQMGNSEVGHLNIGAGRVVEQELTRINRASTDGSMSEIPELQSIFTTIRSNPDRALHFVGLISTGGVHSNVEHLNALIAAARSAGVERICIHCITDGRDRPPTASEEEVNAFVDGLAQFREGLPADGFVHVSSVIGRYYPMDRDKRWDRVKLGYDLFTGGVGEVFPDVRTALATRHEAGETDEFITPIALGFSNDAITRSPAIEDADAVVFFNFRTDRMRQIVPALLGTISENGAPVPFEHFERLSAPALSGVATLTEYSVDFDVDVLFRPFHVVQHLGEIVSGANMKQLRIAETEKYPHVTYFFNGGDEMELPGEERVLIPSPRDVATYDEKPEMSANEVTDALVARIEKGGLDLAVVNFANCDMVGHTGNLGAAIKAVETVDSCLSRVIEAVLAAGGALLVTADHGNADQMIDYDTGKPHTYHTTYPVPVFLVAENLGTATLRDGGALCDIAPTICDLLGIDTPAEMTGVSLLKEYSTEK